MRTCLCVSVTQRAINILCSRSRLLSHDSPNRKRGVPERKPIDNGLIWQKGFQGYANNLGSGATLVSLSHGRERLPFFPPL